jgi:hypothetical protein
MAAHPFLFRLLRPRGFTPLAAAALLLLALLGAALPARAEVFTVTSAASDGAGTLRWAITQANAAAAAAAPRHEVRCGLLRCSRGRAVSRRRVGRGFLTAPLPFSFFLFR